MSFLYVPTILMTLILNKCTNYDKCIDVAQQNLFHQMMSELRKTFDVIQRFLKSLTIRSCTKILKRVPVAQSN